MPLITRWSSTRGLPRVSVGNSRSRSKLFFAPIFHESFTVSSLTYAVLLPVCRLHHLFDARPLRTAQQCEHTTLLGEVSAASGDVSRACTGVSEVTAVGAGLRRGAGFDLAPVFGAVLLAFEDFLAERVDMAMDSIG
jgi:hypothetical protein